MRTLHYQLCAVVDLSFLKVKKNSVVDSISMFPALQYTGQDDLYPGEGGTLEISGWGCVAGTLEHLTSGGVRTTTVMHCGFKIFKMATKVDSFR